VIVSRCQFSCLAQGVIAFGISAHSKKGLEQEQFTNVTHSITPQKLWKEKGQLKDSSTPVKIRTNTSSGVAMGKLYLFLC